MKSVNDQDKLIDKPQADAGAKRDAAKAPAKKVAAKKAAHGTDPKKDKEKPVRAVAGAPMVKKGDALTNQALLQNWRKRPMVGRDLHAISKELGLTAAEFGTALGIANDHNLSLLMKSNEVLAYDVEMLARIYVSYPSPAPWIQVNPKDLFDKLYGPYLRKFKDEQDRAYARTNCFTRFTATVDRSSSTAYRWIDGKGRSRLTMVLLLRKISEFKRPLEELEDLARLMHMVRGGNFERRGPLPPHGEKVVRRGRAPEPARQPKEVLPAYSSNPFADA